MKLFAALTLFSSLAYSAPQPQRPLPENGENGDNGGIFGVGIDILWSGFISPDLIAGTLGMDRESAELIELVPAIQQILLSDPTPGGTGPYPATFFEDESLPDHTIYAPAQYPADVQLPIVIWGNGFCLSLGNFFHPFLQEIASHGYIVIASGRPLKSIAADLPAFLAQDGIQSSVAGLTQAIDWVELGGAAKYGNVDTSRIAVAGQSCGGQQAYSASYHDERVKLTMVFNSGVFIPARRYLLYELTAPVAYFVGGEVDLGYDVSLADYPLLRPGLPAVWSSLPTGHIGTYWAENGGKSAIAAVTYLDWWFKGDQNAKAKFLLRSSPGSLASQGWTIKWKNIQ